MNDYKAPIQFGSINQPVHATTTDVGTRSTEIQYGTTSPQDTANHYNVSHLFDQIYIHVQLKR